MIHATRRQKIVCVCVCVQKNTKTTQKICEREPSSENVRVYFFSIEFCTISCMGQECVCVFFMLKNCNNNKNIQNILLYIITQETCIFSVNRIGHRKSRNKNMLFTSMPFGNLLLIIMHVRIYIDDPCECMHVLIIAVYARLWRETERELLEE